MIQTDRLDKMADILEKLMLHFWETYEKPAPSYSTAVSNPTLRVPEPYPNKERSQSGQRTNSFVTQRRKKVENPADALVLINSMQEKIGSMHAHFGVLINETGKTSFADVKNEEAKILDVEANLLVHS